jgi:hypothetical protein
LNNFYETVLTLNKSKQNHYFDTNHFITLVRLFPGLFWGQPIDSGGGLAVFVNKINNLATQSWKKNLAFAS